jgi:hypothetical protein
LTHLTRTAITSAAFLIMVVATAPLAGCAYDYAQHTDRVSFRAGNAVAQNLEAETINPAKRSMYAKGGLGKNGVVTSTSSTGTSAAGAQPAN